MAVSVKSKTKYICKDKEKLKEFMKKEGFIFKNSIIENDEYYMDSNFDLKNNNSCIRLRTLNNKDMILSFDGFVGNISNIDISDTQTVYLDVSQQEKISSFLACIGYYKYICLNILKETYIKKDREFYYSICIDTIEDVGEFVDYDVYSEVEDENKINNIFYDFESKVNSCIGETCNLKYRDYSSNCIYNIKLKGNNLNRILVEFDKIFCNLEIENIEQYIKNNITILNLELIEKLEQYGIQVEVVYSASSEVMINALKKALDRIGYTPKFINITDIKEIAVKETFILEKQKKMSFSEVAFIIILNRLN